MENVNDLIIYVPIVSLVVGVLLGSWAVRISRRTKKLASENKDITDSLHRLHEDYDIFRMRSEYLVKAVNEMIDRNGDMVDRADYMIENALAEHNKSKPLIIVQPEKLIPIDPKTIKDEEVKLAHERMTDTAKMARLDQQEYTDDQVKKIKNYPMRGPYTPSPDEPPEEWPEWFPAWWNAIPTPEDYENRDLRRQEHNKLMMEKMKERHKKKEDK